MSGARSVSTPSSLECPRRAVLRGAAGVVLAWLTPIRAFAAQEEKGPPPAAGDLLVRVEDPNLIPLAPDDVPFDGRGVMVWAIGPADSAAKTGQLNKIFLARLNPANMADTTRQRAADDIVAYSAVCTHAGCDVDEGLGSNESVFCSCHGSSFDARNGGVPMGGPANMRLAALPLKVESGRLVVAGPWVTPPGFGPG
jgi:rieske iron-sulfur protein